MKKFGKIAALVAALGFALFLAGCSNSSDSGSNNANGAEAGTETLAGGTGTGTTQTPEDGAGSGTGNGGGQSATEASAEYTKVGTETIGSTTYDLVTFGLWPQTIIAAGVTVDKNTCQKQDHGAFTYCKGSDGEWYVEQAEKAWESGYKYSDGTTVRRGGTSEKWFKVEPIKWRVLTDNYGGNKLLLAESILIGKRYDDNKNNYKDSEIRAWLIGDFLQSAFTSAQQGQIKTTTVDNSARSTNPDANATELNSGNNQYASDTPTSDKIFLLSEQEVTRNAYGFEAYNSYGAGNKRIRVTTDFAKATGAYQNSTASRGGCWWLRSPSFNSGLSAHNVSDDGYAELNVSVSLSKLGVVPVLCISN
ncbi:MAG: hypothetical protein IK015_08775 [Treponema sp.]|nr:hypothetical protein [Treponema sp.]